MKSEEAFVGPDTGSYRSGESSTDSTSLSDLYLADETAWLDQMAQLVSERRYRELDCDHLSEFLTDMAKRDRREVLSRLEVLLVHLLKWGHQVKHRSRSWRSSIEEQRARLADLFESETLRKYGEDALNKAYERAIKLASIETGLAASDFPQACPWTLQEAIGQDPENM